LAVKKFGEKGYCKVLAKKLWWMLTCIANRQSSINSKTKPNNAIPNIDEHNKMNSVFLRICLVPCASSMLFDDGEVHCRVYNPWLSRIYKQTIVWKWTGSLKILQYQYHLDPYAKQIKTQITSCYKSRKIGKKVGELLWFAKFAKVFLLQSFLLYSI